MQIKSLKSDMELFNKKSHIKSKFSIGIMKAFDFDLVGNQGIAVKKISKKQIFGEKNYLRILKELYTLYKL